MGDPRGFLKVKRASVIQAEREFREQASRCMDCGTPFCHWGCPIGNYIPEWNDLVFNGHWKRAFELLSAVNPLPEVTGRICPAICEYACVLGINDEPVAIRENELAVIEYAFKQGWVKPSPPGNRTGKRVAVVGSGPAGLACAATLNKAGHSVMVFEKEDKIGGILRHGIPDFKLEKWILDRRIEIWEKEGIEFKTGVEVKSAPKGFDAVVLACGCQTPRDLRIEGRELSGIYFALDYLTQPIDAKGKKVAVIGGGDTGADCVGTAYHRGAKSIVQIEILPEPPETRSVDQPWPQYPIILKPEKNAQRLWSTATKKFIGEQWKVKKLICESEGKEFEIEADLVILALGFLPFKQISLPKGVFCAGDMRRGPSLIVWAIYEGRQAAHFIDLYLTDKTSAWYYL